MCYVATIIPRAWATVIGIRADLSVIIVVQIHTTDDVIMSKPRDELTLRTVTVTSHMRVQDTESAARLHTFCSNGVAHAPRC